MLASSVLSWSAISTSFSSSLKRSVVELSLFFTVPVPTFENLWFRFQLLKIYGSGSNF
jgi:hypothetical protein